MTSKELTVLNKVGFHARPASMLIDAAKGFKSRVTVTKGDATIPLNSLISLMKLRVHCGDVVTIAADGEDEQAAVNKLAEMVNSKFGEE
jgi:phosphotransferase system HPr (HPr) family protein